MKRAAFSISLKDRWHCVDFCLAIWRISGIGIDSMQKREIAFDKYIFNECESPE